MFLKRLKFNNYRNYDSLEFEFSKNKTLFVGKNAQGKTNLLEAVYYLSALNSSRIKKDKELIKFGNEFCNINATVLKSETDVELDILINPPKNKVLKVNGIKKNKSRDFVRVLSTVSFANSDLLLLRGEPLDRRKWLDNAICQVYPAYLDKINKYNKIRLQKANFLSDNQGRPFGLNGTGGGLNETMLDVFNTQLANSSANIMYLRMKFLSELKKIAKEKHLSISRDEELNIEYENTLGAEYSSVAELSSLAYEKLCEVKAEEIKKGQCLIGPHRDDVAFFINGLDAKRYASQGQQRTIVLALKLSELDIIQEKINEMPVLLLDDVLAELDNIRQNYLLDTIKDGVQTIITSVDTLAFDDDFLADVEIVQVEGGNIVQK
ncbi:MAG: DNA replication/repair protein RecF [Candidatus Gastranaerophilales bacterium]|nr:DNA replication/repair protein RecF [Candidatus Gastranaerophilales bacterium]